jgi:hypothetical protein
MSTPNHPFTQLRNDVVFDKRVSGMAVKLLAALEKFAGKKNVCWPSQKTLAALLSVSERYIRKLLKQLVDLGLVAYKRGGFAKPNYYTLLKRVIHIKPVRNSQDHHSGTSTTAEPYPTNNNHYRRGQTPNKKLKDWEQPFNERFKGVVALLNKTEKNT